MMRYLITLFFLPFLLLGDDRMYIFPDITLSGSIGYKHQEISLGYRENHTPDKKTTEEKINNLQTLMLALEARIFEPCLPYVRGLLSVGSGWGNKGNWEMAFYLGETPHSGNGTFKAHSLFLNTTGEIGYTFRAGPLAFAPYVGFTWQRQNVHRKDITLALFPIGDFRPNHYYWYRLITPLAGIRIALLPTLHCRFQMEASYSYAGGQLLLRSNYKIDNLDKRYLNQCKTHRYGSIQDLEVLLSYGVSEHWIVSAAFQYEYVKAKSKNNKTHETIFSATGLSDFSFAEKRNIAFLGFRNQSYGCEFKLSYGF